MLDDVIKFKMHILKSLEDYEAFVVDEVEQELGQVDESFPAANARKDGEGSD